MFLVAIGTGIAVGGLGPQRWLVPSLVAGAALGTPSPSQWIVLGVAFLVEGYLVYLVSDRNVVGSREFWMWMLGAVAAHFLILTVSHGPLCGVLAVLCLGNAFIGLRADPVDFHVFWTIDGVLKVLVGASMGAVTYVAVD